MMKSVERRMTMNTELEMLQQAVGDADTAIANAIGDVDHDAFAEANEEYNEAKEALKRYEEGYD
jgi:cellobiose-specific phosphotransferase system component IIA